MINFLRWFVGYLEIEVSGYSPKRFINLCANNQILLWDIFNTHTSYQMKILLRDFWKIKKLVKKTSVKVVISNRYGLPFFMKKSKMRVFFYAGIPICIFVLFILAQFLWAMEFEGNYSISDDTIEDFLLEEEIYIGIYRKKINVEDLEKKLREKFSNITWVSATINGTKLYVRIKEEDVTIYSSNIEYESSSLIAHSDGTIQSIVTKSGVPLVKAGDEVEKGQILVDGNIPIYDNEGNIIKYNRVNAEADIIISYLYPVNEELERVYHYKNYTGNELKKSYLEILNQTFLLDFRKIKYLYYDMTEISNQVKIGNQFFVPIFFKERIYKEYHLVEAIYSESKSNELIHKKIDKIISNLEEKGVQIIEKNVKIDSYEKNVKATGYLFVYDTIKERMEIKNEDDGTSN
ncbi:MAG: sporulation protein YqfD [Lachnospiraceae bacterium]